MTIVRFEDWRDIPDWWGDRYPNFKPFEIACSHCAALAIDLDALDRLQAARSRGGRGLSLSSAYRCPIYNALVGGAPLSRHKVCDAFDVRLMGAAKAELHRLFIAAGFRGFGLNYRTFIHIDMGPKRSW